MPQLSLYDYTLYLLDDPNDSEERKKYKKLVHKRYLEYIQEIFDEWLPKSLKRFDKLYEMTKDEIELEMNLPFNSSGIKVIKCHDFSYQLDFLSETWPECPIIMCHRPMEISYDWWMHIGGPNITYPSYKSIDPKKYINLCNDGIYDFIKKNKTIEVKNNMELCEVLEIDPVNDIYYYDNSDGKNVITNVNVKV
jgi:hypothetical protein